MKDLEKPAHILQDEMSQAAAAQTDAEIQNGIKRFKERMEHYRTWVDPKNIAERWRTYAESSKAALEAGKAAGRNLEPLPVPDPLPAHMKGQSPSTIQAMLRNGWKPDDVG